MPASGTIVASVTYTLKADCTQTGYLEIKTADTPNVELTINGAGWTISGRPGQGNFGFSFLIVDDQGILTVVNRDKTANPNVKVTIKNVTFDGNGWAFGKHQRIRVRYDGTENTYWGGIGSWILAEGTLEMENVTFTDGNGSWLEAEGKATLKNVLFEEGGAVLGCSEPGQPQPVSRAMSCVTEYTDLPANKMLGAGGVIIYKQ